MEIVSIHVVALLIFPKESFALKKGKILISKKVGEKIEEPENCNFYVLLVMEPKNACSFSL